MQAKLLRVIEDGEIQKIGSAAYVSSDFRLIAATNKDLTSAIKDGTFRDDLYHRLNILVLKVPSLRDRPEDVLHLAHDLMNSMSEKPPCSPVDFAPEVKQLFQKYPWPGNIRELKNVLSFAVFSLDEDQNEIKLRNLPPYLLEKSLVNASPPGDIPASLSLARERSEKEALINAFEAAGNNKAKAARILGISRNEVYKKMKKYKLLNPCT